MREELYYKYWKQAIKDYIECAFDDFYDYEKRIQEMNENDKNIIFDKVINGLMNDDHMWAMIHNAIDDCIYEALIEYENEKGE